MLVGIEVESSRIDSPNDYDEFQYWEHDEDGSIQVEDEEEASGEFRLGEPLTPAKTWEALEELRAFGRSRRWKVNKSCGLHIHLDKDSIPNLDKFIRTWKILEDFIFRLMPVSRRDNSFCKPIRGCGFSCEHEVNDSPHTTHGMEMCFRPMRWWEKCRYHALNRASIRVFVSAMTRSTVPYCGANRK